MAATQPTVTLKQIAADLAEKHELSKKLMNEILGDDLVTLLVKNLKKGNRIRIAGFGVLQVRKRAARQGRNPRSGESIQVPPKRVVYFKLGKELRSKLIDD